MPLINELMDRHLDHDGAATDALAQRLADTARDLGWGAARCAELEQALAESLGQLPREHVHAELRKGGMRDRRRGLDWVWLREADAQPERLPLVVKGLSRRVAEQARTRERTTRPALHLVSTAWEGDQPVPTSELDPYETPPPPFLGPQAASVLVAFDIRANDLNNTTGPRLKLYDSARSLATERDALAWDAALTRVREGVAAKPALAAQREAILRAADELIDRLFVNAAVGPGDDPRVFGPPNWPQRPGADRTPMVVAGQFVGLWFAKHFQRGVLQAAGRPLKFGLKAAQRALFADAWGYPPSVVNHLRPGGKFHDQYVAMVAAMNALEANGLCGRPEVSP